MLLVYLSLARSGLDTLPDMHLPNLKTFVLSSNFLTEIAYKHLQYLPNLQNLVLDGNPLTSMFSKKNVNPPFIFPKLGHLDVSNVSFQKFYFENISMFTKLSSLNLSQSKISELISTNGKMFPLTLQRLDVKGSPNIRFPQQLLKPLSNLKEVWTDNFKLCCAANLPDDFELTACHAPIDELSSCESLLRSHLYRVFLTIFTILALSGNLAAFFSRSYFGKIEKGFDVLTLMLCVSDMLMGVYLAVIGIADRVYMGSYLWKDETWRTSFYCTVAGFLCMVSNEVSALTVCLITLDRLLVLRFPFSRLRFSKRMGTLVCGAVWAVGISLAMIPLMPQTRHWAFYSHNAICMPLPITRQDFPGHRYSFGLLIVFNLIVFVFIAVGQVLIYQSVQKNSLKNAEDMSTRSGKEGSLARRLFTVAMSDFLCWFPVGLLGVLAALGVPVSGEVNVAMAIFVLPVNSAINPYLYTVNQLLEKRRQKREERLIAAIAAKVKRQMAV